MLRSPGNLIFLYILDYLLTILLNPFVTGCPSKLLNGMLKISAISWDVLLQFAQANWIWHWWSFFVTFGFHVTGVVVFDMLRQCLWKRCFVISFLYLPFNRFRSDSCHSSFLLSMWRAQVAVNVTHTAKLKPDEEEGDDWKTDPDFIVGLPNSLKLKNIYPVSPRRLIFFENTQTSNKRSYESTHSLRRFLNSFFLALRKGISTSLNL